MKTIGILKFICIFTFILLIVSCKSKSQIVNDSVKVEQENSENFVKQNRAKIRSLVSLKDRQFINTLKSDWVQLKTHTELEYLKDEKPINIPKVEKRIKLNNNQLESNNTELYLKSKDHAASPFNPFINYDNLEIKKSISVNFYGENIQINLYDNFPTEIKPDISNEKITNIWNILITGNYDNLVLELLQTKSDLKLSDWAYYMLVNDVAMEIAENSENTAKIITWFLMVKSKYDVKIAYNFDKIFLLLYSPNKIFEMSYVNIDNKKYYIDGKTSVLYTYQNNHGDIVYPIYLNIENSINLPENNQTKKISFDYKNKNYTIDIEYNKNIIDFYRDYPLTNLSTYFNSSISLTTKSSILKKIKPLIDDKSEEEAVNLLLALCQKGFNYKTDKEQFGKEKYFFPEEILSYQYSDCEDRAVFFSFLVKELLNLDVVGVYFPGHISTAVKFNETITGQFYIHNSQKYIICDPTYLNAPVGYCMPKLINKDAIIIADNQNERRIHDFIENKIRFAGANPMQLINDFENKKDCCIYITGSFTDELVLDKRNKLKSKGESDFFIAKYKTNGTLVWADQIGGTNNESGYMLQKSDNEIFVSGLYSEQFRKKKYKSPKADKPNVFLAKYSEKGKLLNISFSNLSKIPIDYSYVYELKFNKDGDILKTYIYDNAEYYTNFGIFINSDERKILGTLPGISIAYNPNSILNNEAATRSFYVSSNYIPIGWKTERKRLIKSHYEKTIAGLFAYIFALKTNGSYVSGSKTMQLITKYNPSLRKIAPELYNSLNNIKYIKNKGGIITLKTKNKKPLYFNDIVIEDNAKFQIITYRGGNAKLIVLKGAKLGKSFVEFKLNYFKLIRINGDILLDFDQDHYQKKINLKKDILKNPM